MPPKQERSFGVVPVRFDGRRPVFLLVRHRAGHWAFPKGHAEPGETPLQAARREFIEETSIGDYRRIRGAVFEERYRLTRKGRPVRKTVRYYLVLVGRARVRIPRPELRAFVWLPYRRARARITFAQSKRLIDRARRHLKKVAAAGIMGARKKSGRKG